jgi:hypothetical protein
MQPNSANQLGRCYGTAGEYMVLLVLADLVVTADFPAAGSGVLSLLEWMHLAHAFRILEFLYRSFLGLLCVRNSCRFLNPGNGVCKRRC